jgi:hypothetical protein
MNDKFVLYGSVKHAFIFLNTWREAIPTFTYGPTILPHHDCPDLTARVVRQDSHILGSFQFD